MPWLLGLGIVAWVAAVTVNEVTQAWLMRDVALRARLAAVSTQASIAAHLGAGERRKLEVLLDDLSRDERIMGVQVCTPALATVSRTKSFPDRFRCEALRSRVPHGVLPAELDFSDEVDGGRLHVSVHRIDEEGAIRGALVLVHDLSFVARRELAAKRFTLAAFALVAVLASILTIVVRRASWRSWTDELRGLLSFARGSPSDTMPEGRNAFHPLLADVRKLVAELAAERAASLAPWSAERLQHVLRENLHGESVVILANREPYIHDRAPDGGVRVLHPASGLVTALEPIMRACSGTWIAHGAGTADRDTVDSHDRVLVPPGEESYALRRVWLSKEEERGYYYGFANEGLWPLCHIAHTRPEFRASDWREYEASTAASPTRSARRSAARTPSCSSRTTTSRSRPR